MQEGTAGTLRAALLLLVALGVVGIAVALALNDIGTGRGSWCHGRHSTGSASPWALLLVRTTRATVWFARVLAVLVIVAAVLGVWRHFDENYSTAPLDARYSERWDTMSTGARLWEITKGTVGHVPVPAAGALVPIGVALAMATIGLGGSPRAATRANRRKH